MDYFLFSHYHLLGALSVTFFSSDLPITLRVWETL